MVGLAPELREKTQKRKKKSGPKPLIAHELKKSREKACRWGCRWFGYGGVMVKGSTRPQGSDM
jgi:hypothetical protein